MQGFLCLKMSKHLVLLQTVVLPLFPLVGITSLVPHPLVDTLEDKMLHQCSLFVCLTCTFGCASFAFLAVS